MLIRFIRSFSRALLSIVALVAIASPVVGQEVVRVSGTGSGTGGMKLLAGAFMKANPGIAIEVPVAMGSAGGISALIEGKLDASISNRAPNEKELARAALTALEYAQTPFVIAVHKELGIAGLTGAQLAALYAEGAASFPNGKRARPVLRLADATDTALLKSFAPEVAVAVEAAGTRRGMLHANTDAETADLLEKTPGAFAVSTLALIESERRALVALAIDGKAPTVANLANGTYPYSKSLFLITAPTSSAATRRFVAFVQSSEGRHILAAHGHLVR